MKFPIALGRCTIAVATCSHAIRIKALAGAPREKPDCQELNINIMVNWFIESFGMQRHETYRIFERALT